MKKLFLMFSVVAATFALGSCSSDEPIGANGEPEAGTSSELGEPQFLTVNLVTNTGNGSRADAQPDGAEYEAGLEAENKVSKVRFYFFDASGNAAAVRYDNVSESLVNYLDWEDISEAGDDMPNVEKILSATLVIQSIKGDGEPAQLLAIINPTDDPNEERTLKSVATVKKNYCLYNKSGEFVMTNSTYAKDGAKVMAVSVAGKIHQTSGEALNDPVQIYVERTVAKVRLNNSLEPIADKENIFATTTDGSQKVDLGAGEQEIYVKFLGWNTTAVSDLTRLVKEINPAWPEDLFGNNGLPWNWAGYHRSFWAVNATGVKYQYGTFKEAKVTDNVFVAQANTHFDKTDWVYVNENATDNVNFESGANPATPTKVIIAAQLVDSEGNALEFAEYGSTRTTVEGLKTLFANNCGLYKKEMVEEGGATVAKFTKITAADLTIKTATAVGEAGKNKDGRYKVYVQLLNNEDNVWYASNNENAASITAAAANAQLKNLGSAKVWKNGYTYYYFDINHIGSKVGVVRNHIYDANITKLAGLGTPVYDPEEIIYPEKPKDDEQTFIAAQIDILSWRVVSTNVELNWE